MTRHGCRVARNLSTASMRRCVLKQLKGHQDSNRLADRKHLHATSTSFASNASAVSGMQSSKAQLGVQSTVQVEALSATASVCLRSSQWQETIARLSATMDLEQSDLLADVMQANMVISAWARGSHWLQSLAALRRIERPDKVSFNACLNALERSSKWQHCLALLDEMDKTGERLQGGDRPAMDARSVSTVLAALSKAGDWPRALQLFCTMRSWDITPDLHCHTALLRSFKGAWQLGLEQLKILETGDIESAGALVELDAVGYDTILSLCEAGAWRQALRWMEHMQLRQMQPSITGLISVVKAIQKAEDFEGSPKSENSTEKDLNEDSGKTSCRRSMLRDLCREIQQRAISLLREPHRSASRFVQLVEVLDLQRDLKRGVKMMEVKEMREVNETKEAKEVMEVKEEDSGEKDLGEELKEVFREVVLLPVLNILQTTANRDTDPTTSADVAIELQDIHGLGVDFTCEVLKELNMVEEDHGSKWLSAAETALLAALSQSNVPAEPSARHLLSWVSYLVDPKDTHEAETSSPKRPRLLRSTGEIVAHGRHRSSMTHHLHPIFSRHDRSQHSERRALLKVVDRLKEGQAQRDATGSVRLFSCHTPCVSCLFVFAQFRAMYPRIRLTVAFMSWNETFALLQRRKESG